MELPIAPLLATNAFLDPIVAVLHQLLGAIDGVVHNFGLTLILLALIVKVAFWPLTTFQFKSMLKTQALMPKMKALQAKYKNDPERRNAETMALYKENGANPAAGCIPLIVQYPILISLYYTILSDKSMFQNSGFLWIGSKLSAIVPYHILATNLAQLDYVLLAMYAISMYLSVRFTTPAADPQAAQQQKIMAFVSPVMIAFFAVKFQWYSALLIYWLSFNLFGIAQQLYLINKYHRNPAPIGPHPEAGLPEDAKGSGKSGDRKSTVPLAGAPATVGNGSANAASRPGGSKRRRARR